ncbi:MoaD/ThiS family protein [Microbacterium elymi]|uniref:MoaD/ThiS family protein n=1 Tax=Microbacterium elymi TaxID=2909587 RepID=A0ABY5NIB1_9MICO|nr:MoaD/ThiS family protein [Microbacterium elymi]UUT34925.1 MoaD/ThiS family protein [Microbacterium elymi]
MPVVRFFAAAEEAAGAAQAHGRGRRSRALRGTLSAQHPALASILPRCAVLVDGARLDDASPLPESAVIDVLPPFAGG